MARLIYSAIASLDGYVADASGSFDWAAPDETVHAAVNDVLRDVGTHLYGRRLYEVMQAWETMDVTDASPAVQDFAALWRDSDKVVFSTRLAQPSTARTRIETAFVPEAVSALKGSATRDLLVGGPTLAGHAFDAGLVDVVHLFVVPVVVGGGTRALPDGVRLPLLLVDERRFDAGVVHLHYTVAAAA